MEREKFEPFGESVDLESLRVPSGASRWLTLVGSSVFWVLATAIVGARAVYFEPGIFDGFKEVIAFLQGFPKLL